MVSEVPISINWAGESNLIWPSVRYVFNGLHDSDTWVCNSCSPLTLRMDSPVNWILCSLLTRHPGSQSQDVERFFPAERTFCKNEHGTSYKLWMFLASICSLHCLSGESLYKKLSLMNQAATLRVQHQYEKSLLQNLQMQRNC